MLRISGLEIDHLESENSCVREDFPYARGSLIMKGICGMGKDTMQSVPVIGQKLVPLSASI